MFVYIQLFKAAFPAEYHCNNCANHSLQYLIGQFEYCIFRGAVDEGSAERVSDYHDYSADENTQTRCENGMIFQNAV